MKKGMTFVLCFGAWAKPHIYFSSISWQLCLGWVALTIHFCDMEYIWTGLAKHYNQCEHL